MSNQVEKKNQSKSDGERRKGRLSLIWRILKWVGLAILSLLLILAIVFQAPWKVITLLAILLAACTILPKHLRKWYWLSAAAIVIVLIIWIFLPENNEGWRPYTFDEELAAMEAKYAVPDEENAALIYDELFKTMDTDLNEPEFLLRSRPSSTDKPWLSKDHPETAEWLKGYERTIEKLLQAAKKDKCHFPIPADTWSLGQHMERLPKMRRCTFLVLSAANNDIAEGRIDAGLEKYLAVVQMAKHQCQQPALIDLLVGVAIEALATKQFKRFVVTGDATEERLYPIERALATTKRDWSSDWPRILDFEKLFAKNFHGQFYEINSKGKTRFNRSSIALTNRQLEQMKVKLTYWIRKRNKAKAILMWLYMPATPRKVGRIVDASYEKYYAMAKPDFDWKKGPKKLSSWLRRNYQYLIKHMANMCEAPYYRIHDIYLRTVAEQKGCQLIIALRRYKNINGRWPESLCDIKSLAPTEIFVDPINGDSFVYKLTEENFTLYSKGKNNVDENGKYKRGADDWPIWPSKSSKTQEKTEDAE